MGASIGISLFPQEGASPHDIFRQAEIAMYRAKDQGRNIVRVFQPEMRRAVEDFAAARRRVHDEVDAIVDATLATPARTPTEPEGQPAAPAEGGV